MATIYNDTEYTFSPAAQNAINLAAANFGVDEVNAVPSEPGDGILFDLLDNEDNYLFSINTETNEVFEAH